jgi:hypothetical protein
LFITTGDRSDRRPHPPPELQNLCASFSQRGVRCPVLRVDPAQRPRLEEIRINLADRIIEAEREGWLGEAEGLRVSLAAAEGKLAQLDERQRRATTVNLGIPTFREIAGRTATLPTDNLAIGTA